MKAQRLLWIVNHNTLMEAEIPVFEALGWRAFIPKVVKVNDPDYRSAMTTHDFDGALGLSPGELDVLNAQDFYDQQWSPELARVINDRFDVIVSTFSVYLTPLVEAVEKFQGLVVGRAFGREVPFTYSDFLVGEQGERLARGIETVGARFVFAQGYRSIGEAEGPLLSERAVTVTVPIPQRVLAQADSWRGDGSSALFLCPDIGGSPYYGAIYRTIKGEFGTLPHQIFGRQSVPIDDSAVLPYLTDDELFSLYSQAPVFVYPSSEPRHVHYSPVEAIVVGTPTLYLRGALLDSIAGRRLPGACNDLSEMRAKAEALLAGDRSLAQDIRATQSVIVDDFMMQTAVSQWKPVLMGAPRRYRPVASRLGMWMSGRRP